MNRKAILGLWLIVTMAGVGILLAGTGAWAGPDERGLVTPMAPVTRPQESNYGIRATESLTSYVHLPLVLCDYGITVHRDLTYASYELNGAQYDLLLDLYLPKSSAAQSLPLVIYIHGGGWIEGDKDGFPYNSFVQQGYALASINYRLGDHNGCPPELTFPVQIHDVKAAVRWLRQHAGEYNLDAQRFGALGDSSGGHLAALLGVSHGVAALEGPANPGVSDAVQAVCDWYGPVDITQGPVVFNDDPCTTDYGYLQSTYGGIQYFYWTFAWGTFLGGSLVDPVVLGRANQATPLTYVDAGDPPFLIIHGELDDMVLINQGELLSTALSNAGVSVNFIRLPNADHSYGELGQTISPEFLQPTLAFFDTHLKPGP